MPERNRPAALAAALALVLPGALTVATVPAPAAAQACRIAPMQPPVGPYPGWMLTDAYPRLGQVLTFGDLKIRIAAVDVSNKTVSLDVKTPDFAMMGVRFVDNSTYKFNACGGEVSIAFTHNGGLGMISVGIF